MKIDRLMTLTNILINKKNVTAKYLAEELEVSVRTIYRDIDVLSMSGIPIVTEKGVNGGISIMPDYKPDKNIFKKEDFITIISIIESLNNYIPAKEYKRISEKLRTYISKEEIEELQTKESVIFDYSPWNKENRQSEILSRIKKAIDNEILLKIKYTNNKFEKSERIIEPMNLILKNYSWYLFGFCRQKKDYRIFKVSRINNINEENSNFIKKNVNIREVLKEKWYENEKKIELILAFNEKYKEKILEWFSEDDIFEKKDSKIFIKILFPLNEIIYNYILSFGDMVEIVEPEFVREEIKKRIKNMSEKYF